MRQSTVSAISSTSSLSAMSEAWRRTLPMSKLAAVTNASCPGCRMCRQLEQHGWVRRSGHPTNGRVTHATLTDDGWRSSSRRAQTPGGGTRAGHRCPQLSQLGQLAAIANQILDRVAPGDAVAIAAAMRDR